MRLVCAYHALLAREQCTLYTVHKQTGRCATKCEVHNALIAIIRLPIAQ